MERIISIIDYFLIVCGIGTFIYFILHNVLLSDGLVILVIVILLKLGKVLENRFVHFLAYASSSFWILGLLLESLLTSINIPISNSFVTFLFIVSFVVGIIFAVVLRYSSYLLTFLWSGIFIAILLNGIKQFGIGEFFFNFWNSTFLYSTYEKYFSLFLLILMGGIVFESYRKLLILSRVRRPY